VSEEPSDAEEASGGKEPSGAEEPSGVKEPSGVVEPTDPESGAGVDASSEPVEPGDDPSFPQCVDAQRRPTAMARTTNGVLPERIMDASLESVVD
jgi:hypothetical protein